MEFYKRTKQATKLETPAPSRKRGLCQVFFVRLESLVNGRLISQSGEYRLAKCANIGADGFCCR